jgi:endo-1,3(4)-beta-glucanase
MYENKIDHATYFGPEPVFVHGIQMIPILPTTGYIRSPKFVREEFERWFATGRAAEKGPSWHALVMADLAVGNATASWKHFSDEKFNLKSLDTNEATTLSWYLWYAAALGGAE